MSSWCAWVSSDANDINASQSFEYVYYHCTSIDFYFIIPKTLNNFSVPMNFGNSNKFKSQTWESWGQKKSWKAYTMRMRILVVHIAKIYINVVHNFFLSSYHKCSTTSSVECIIKILKYLKAHEDTHLLFHLTAAVQCFCLVLLSRWYC